MDVADLPVRGGIDQIDITRHQRLKCLVGLARDILPQQLDVIVGESDLHTSLIPSRLLRSAAREYSDRSCPEALKDDLDRLAESVPIGKKKDDGDVFIE